MLIIGHEEINWKNSNFSFGEVSQGLVKTLDIDAGARECRALRYVSKKAQCLKITKKCRILAFQFWHFSPI